MGRNGLGVVAAGLGGVGLWALLSGLATPVEFAGEAPPAPADRAPASVSSAAPLDGGELVRVLGCGGCHQGVGDADAAREASPAFGPDGIPLDPDFVYTYLADPERRRTGIAPTRMPDFRLSERERLALAVFLAGGPDGGPVGEAGARHPDVDAADGERLFAAFNCGACHTHPDARTWSDGPDLGREGARVRPQWLRDYLAEPRTIRPTGHRPGLGSRMPDFRLTDDELEAVSAYLLSLSDPEPEPTAVEAAPTPFRARRTERLVRDRLSCLGCHALEGEGGRLGPPLDGVAERLAPAFVRSMIHRPRETVPGARMPAPLFAPERLDEVARWLVHREGTWAGGDEVPVLELVGAGAAGPPVGNLDVGGDESMAEADGAALYGRWCAHCHGAGGEGDGWNAGYLGVMPTPHASDSLMSERPDDTLYDGVHAGGWVLDRSNRMPAFGRTLGRDQIRALVGYIRTLCDCLGPAWSRDGRPGDDRRGAGR